MDAERLDSARYVAQGVWDTLTSSTPSPPSQLDLPRLSRGSLDKTTIPVRPSGADEGFRETMKRVLCVSVGEEWSCELSPFGPFRA